MSFTARVKQEIIGKNLGKDSERRAFLSGFVRATGSIIEKDGEYGFEFSTESVETAEYVSYLLGDLFGLEPDEQGADKDSRGRRTTFECAGNGAVEVLHALDILTPNNALNFDLQNGFLKTESETRAFIKGVFVGSGNVTVPVMRAENRSASTGYHLEFVFFGYRPAQEFTALLAEVGILTKLTERKDNYVIYIKSSEEIKDFLAFLGASKAALELTGIIIEKEISADANRQKNCDLANVTKQLDAAERHISAIGEIDRLIGLDALGEPLKQTAIARRDNPEDTLFELAEHLGITKSCLNHRLRKLLAIEKNLVK